MAARPIDWVAVKGRTQGQRVFELLGRKGEGHDELVRRYTEALDLYRAQKWQEAARGFQSVLELRPGDAPSELMLRRCAEYEARPPGPDWDGVHRVTSK